MCLGLLRAPEALAPRVSVRLWQEGRRRLISSSPSNGYGSFVLPYDGIAGRDAASKVDHFLGHIVICRRHKRRHKLSRVFSPRSKVSGRGCRIPAAMAFLSNRTTRTHAAWRKETLQEGRNCTLRFSHLSTREKRLVTDVPFGKAHPNGNAIKLNQN